ncbi:phosphatidate phosphatase LPIN1-like [Centruroides sculpturatus]|uniref:phosphatidate phosphatase LPIN1-like n=1 Tax=Centruroides sculpturatus TaxID=218467 RepID=UPI000C6DF8C3|nr:phosphatidate phosphatase LPIN1-like [Centruroides sculpturatus]
MKLGESGEAFFVEETDDEMVPSHLATSPIPPAPNLEEELKKLKESSKGSENISNGDILLINGESYLKDSDFFQQNVDSKSISSDQSENYAVKESENEMNLQTNIVNNQSYNNEVPNFLPVQKEVSVAIQTENCKEENETKSSDPVQSVSIVIDESDDAKSKRKRKKKLRPKTRAYNKENKIPYGIRESANIPMTQSIPIADHRVADQAVQEEEEEIFHMDEDYNDDEGFSAASMIRSMSLPLNSAVYREHLRKNWPTRRLSATYTGELHPFSDGDVTPPCSPPESRPPSPKSDTEFEIQKNDAICQTECDEVSWDWGELPSIPKKSMDGKGKLIPKVELLSSDDEDQINKSNKTEEEKRSMLSGMWNFMRSTKKLRHMPESEGIYLDDLNFNDLDPEIAALYLPKFRSQYPIVRVKNQMLEDDAESGNGPSLPQSPRSVEGVLEGSHGLDSDVDDRHSSYNYYSKYYDDLAMSLCGGLQDTEGEIPDQCFLQSLITYDDFLQNTSLLQNPNLVIRMGGKYYNWQTAAPMLLSLAMFQRPLPEKIISQLIDAHMPKKKKTKSYSWWNWRRTSQETETKKPDDISEVTMFALLIYIHLYHLEIIIFTLHDFYKPLFFYLKFLKCKIENNIYYNFRYYNWQTAAPMLLSLAMFQRPLPEKIISQLIDAHMPKKKKTKSYSWWNWRRTSQETETKKPDDISERNSSIQSTKQETTAEQSTEKKEILLDYNSTTAVQSYSAESSGAISNSSKGRLDLVKSKEEFYASTSSETEDAGPILENKKSKIKRLYYQERYRKTLRLSSDNIKSLNLKEGPNEVVFSVTTAYQGTTRCVCNVYLWNYDDKIIISDIDGTITKSDVLGHILPIIGKDWAQLGVAKLFSKIQNNGYQFLYLSARAIGQARITRDYLRSVKQGDICLPDGPLLLSPTSLFNALHREVIEKRPEDFKINCLKDIRALFPALSYPFYAGFGNKINDTWSYRAVDIPMGRIFTINHRGELKLELIQTFQSSYTRLSDVVDHIFPPLQRQHTVNLAPNFPAPEEFSYFTYWRYPLPHLEENDHMSKAKEK